MCQWTSKPRLPSLVSRDHKYRVGRVTVQSGQVSQKNASLSASLPFNRTKRSDKDNQIVPPHFWTFSLELLSCCQVSPPPRSVFCFNLCTCCVPRGKSGKPERTASVAYSVLLLFKAVQRIIYVAILGCCRSPELQSAALLDDNTPICFVTRPLLFDSCFLTQLALLLFQMNNRVNEWDGELLVSQKEPEKHWSLGSQEGFF